MKIEKLYEELKRCDLEITKLEQKKTQIKDKDRRTAAFGKKNERKKFVF